MNKLLRVLGVAAAIFGAAMATFGILALIVYLFKVAPVAVGLIIISSYCLLMAYVMERDMRS